MAGDVKPAKSPQGPVPDALPRLTVELPRDFVVLFPFLERPSFSPLADMSVFKSPGFKILFLQKAFPNSGIFL